MTVQDLTAVLEAVRILAVALSPVIPELCGRIYSQLGYSKADFESLSWVCLLNPQHESNISFYFFASAYMISFGECS
jgi:methionyl-tRNA synthetase